VDSAPTIRLIDAVLAGAVATFDHDYLQVAGDDMAV
jgi:hypothetical protein